MAKGARLAASEREVLCLSAQWVQREKGRLGAAAGIGRETIVSSPSPAPFPLQNCLPQGWMPAGRGTRLPQSIQQTPLCSETACTQPGLEKSQLPNSSRISQKFEGIHNIPNRHAASGQRPKLLPKTSPPAPCKPMLRTIPPSPHPAAGRCFLDISSLGSLSHRAGKQREVPFDTTCPFQSHSFPLRWPKN